MPPQSARRIALVALREWAKGDRFADAIIQELLGATSLASSERAFALELFYGILRNLRLLDFWIALLRSGKIDETCRDLLRLGLYQLFILRTAEHAALYETVHLARPRQRGFINGVLRSAQRRHDELQTKTRAESLGVQTSHPDFLVARWRNNFGEPATITLCEWNNRPAPTYTRVNNLKIATGKFIELHPEARVVASHRNFFEGQSIPPGALEQGLCYMQDPSTMFACDLLDAQPGETILDACAAPGGKTAVIAQQMQNRGTIVAVDREPWRIDRLRENLDRLGATAAQVLQHDWIKTADHSLPAFDRILLDAPCSNTGVMRRRVDVRWRLRPDEFLRMQKRQLILARTILPLLKADGFFVYSTCSLEPEENEEVVAMLQEQFPRLELIGQTVSLPFRDGIDGAFSAKFRLRR